MKFNDRNSTAYLVVLRSNHATRILRIMLFVKYFNIIFRNCFTIAFHALILILHFARTKLHQQFCFSKQDKRGSDSMAEHHWAGIIIFLVNSTNQHFAD